MPWGISDDEMDQALKELFGADPADDDGVPAAVAEPPKPSQLGITSGILSDIPLHLQVPPVNWSGMNLGLSGGDLAALGDGSSGAEYPGQARLINPSVRSGYESYANGESVYPAPPARDYLAGKSPSGFGPLPNFAPSGGQEGAEQFMPALQSHPVNLQNPIPLAQSATGNTRPNYQITPDTVLPDGSTVGGRVDALEKDIKGLPNQMVFTPSGAIAPKGSRLDYGTIARKVYDGTNFKIMFQGSGADPALLGDAGNYAYGKIAARLGVPLDAAKAVAGAYGVAKHPWNQLSGPYMMDKSAREHIEPGYYSK
jgi:hypothetical protein